MAANVSGGEINGFHRGGLLGTKGRAHHPAHPTWPSPHRRVPPRRGPDATPPYAPASAWAPLFLLTLAPTTALRGLSLATGEHSILSHDDGWELFRTVRVPRTVALVRAGAAISLSGLVMQLITQNHFVEPTTTDTTEWADWA